MRLRFPDHFNPKIFFAQEPDEQGVCIGIAFEKAAWFLT